MRNKKSTLSMYIDGIKIAGMGSEESINLAEVLEQIRGSTPELPRAKQPKKKPARGGGRP